MDFGAAVSQKGYDVKTCADRFLVYSSAFQTLKIFNTYSVSTTRPSSGENVITINHNLGYYAPFFVVYNGSTTRGVGSSFFMNDSSFAINARMKVNTLEIHVDDFFDLLETNDGATVYFTVYIFLDDFRTVTEKNVNTDLTSGASSSDYGFRISKPGFDVKTCADKDCTLSSSFFNQIIHKKGITTSDTIAHNLGYVPNFLKYTRYSGGDYIFFDGLMGSMTTTELNTTVLPGETAYYIIFKDKCN